MQEKFNSLCKEYGLETDWEIMDELVFVSSKVGLFYCVFTKQEIASQPEETEKYLVEMCMKSFM
jgi:hypothetical protein